MTSFRLSFRRWQFIVFSLLTCTILFAVLLVFSKQISWQFILLFFLLVLFVVGYFYVGRLSALPERARYVVRALPVFVLVFVLAGFLLGGFFLYILRADAPFAMTGSGDAFAHLPRILLLLIIVFALYLPVLVIIACRELWLTLQTQHSVEKEGICFFTHKKEWLVRYTQYKAVVVGESLVLCCKDDDEIAAAVDFINRPLRQPLLQKSIDGTHFVRTDSLVSDLCARGFVAREEKLAVVICFLD
jgi:hypothetical protein